jgi:hypothetical protein
LRLFMMVALFPVTTTAVLVKVLGRASVRVELYYSNDLCPL